jgi:exodeoxyribonuclease V alpha subunit
MLAERDVPFRYEVPLFASDGTFYLHDFTIKAPGEEWYWEYLGRLDLDEYRNHWEIRKAWYDRFFPGHLVVTQESGNLSHGADSSSDSISNSLLCPVNDSMCRSRSAQRVGHEH